MCLLRVPQTYYSHTASGSHYYTKINPITILGPNWTRLRPPASQLHSTFQPLPDFCALKICPWIPLFPPSASLPWAVRWQTTTVEHTHKTKKDLLKQKIYLTQTTSQKDIKAITTQQTDYLCGIMPQKGGGLQRHLEVPVQSTSLALPNLFLTTPSPLTFISPPLLIHQLQIPEPPL